MSKQYHIGTTGTPWTAAEKQLWFKSQTIKRSYQEIVIKEIKALATFCDIEQYGSLDYQDGTYPVFALKNKNVDTSLPTILVTGGVHGYETSGVLGALAFARHQVRQFTGSFNFVILPCISPWGFETINRWNPDAVDPNRSFYDNSPALESHLAMHYVNQLSANIIAHIDLHETTDTDNSEFRPALAARDGKVNHNWNIPDGFYLVGHTQKPEPAFQKCIIEQVQKVTHIADADDNSQLIGVGIEQFGVINYDATKLGLCMGFTQAQYVTTTEVYPDSEKTSVQECTDGQVAAIIGVIKYLKTL
ncbi:M14 family metallocarboxypeptidase [Pseudoalteromonas luteoviolacea]|uniref:M14 family metallopeptidase n=1 Tax=Pseudoalteromonas luteoviolacea TaxID=43657 RepID=UPI001F2FDFFA|nr:M14 family metallocarboxypeptidase [Pseudoalteromonas luteoviolacea]MCF6442747.1 M14 family metallocarboxypeptidase [Pseudoalteromonas luteoviolacea]